MEPPQLIKEELLEKIPDSLKKPENVGFIAGFSFTVIFAFLLLSRLSSKGKSTVSKADKLKLSAQGAAGKYIDASKKKSGIMSAIVSSSKHYILMLFLSWIKDHVKNYLERVNEDFAKHKKESTGA